MRRIGLFFGTFNPLHNGHLAVAGYMLGWGGIEELWFVVSPGNPFKDAKLLETATQRCEDVQRVIDALGDARVRLSRIELSLPTPSYTIKTLDTLRAKHPDCTFSLIMGGDSLRDLPRWREGNRILEEYRILVYPRGDMLEIPASVAEHRNVKVVDAPLLHISSTFIRNGRSVGKNMDFYTPLLLPKKNP